MSMQAKFLDDDEEPRALTPRKMLEMFNPMPSEKVQAKVNFFFRPYNADQNISKHMRFDVDEKADILQKLKQMYANPGMPVEERLDLNIIIRKISDGKMNLGLKSKEDKGWENLFKFVFNTDNERRQNIISIMNNRMESNFGKKAEKPKFDKKRRQGKGAGAIPAMNKAVNLSVPTQKRAHFMKVQESDTVS